MEAQRRKTGSLEEEKSNQKTQQEGEGKGKKGLKRSRSSLEEDDLNEKHGKNPPQTKNKGVKSQN